MSDTWGGSWANTWGESWFSGVIVVPPPVGDTEWYPPPMVRRPHPQIRMNLLNEQRRLSEQIMREDIEILRIINEIC